MKKFKQIASLALVFLMMLALVIPAFADETDPAGDVTSEEETTAPVAGVGGEGEDAVKGSITINDAVIGETYNIYRVLILESYNTAADAYSYVADEDWVDFFTSNAAATAIFELNPKGNYVTKKVQNPTAAQLQTFASAVLKYAKDNGIAATASAEEVKSATIAFNDLGLGYYVVSSTLGTICSIDTTRPDVVIREKNATATVDKSVNDQNLNIGDTATFTLDVQVNADGNGGSATAAGYIKKFIIHDKMDESLDFIRKSLTVVINRGADDITDESKYKLRVGAEETTDGCTFGLIFDDDYLMGGDVITITYDATLNSKATIGSDGNNNKAYLTYGGNQSEESEVNVYTTGVNIFKYEDNAAKTPLPGAEFVLRKNVGTSTAPVYKYYMATFIEEDGVKKVEKVEWIDDLDNATVVVTDAEGNAAFVGIEAGSRYSLEEIKAPDGYNKLIDPIPVSIVDTIRPNGTLVDGAFVPVTSEVSNSKGALLPTTGGMGTTLFIAFGAIVALGTGVILVTRRRVSMMNNED